MARCRHCHKVAYTTQAIADEVAARHSTPRRPIHVYPCAWTPGTWHITHAAQYDLPTIEGTTR